jgi:hypothetical protein
MPANCENDICEKWLRFIKLKHSIGDGIPPNNRRGNATDDAYGSLDGER